MLITICNQKGGSGKTTTTLLLAMALESIGRSVAIVDRDPQQTSSRAIANLKSNDLTTIDIVEEPGDHDITIFDTAPRLEDALATCIQAADKVILVSSPSPADLWSTQESRDFVLENLQEGAKCAVLFNNVLRSAKISRDLARLGELIGLPSLQSYLPRKQSYQYAVLQGWGKLSAIEREDVKNCALEIGTF